MWKGKNVDKLWKREKVTEDSTRVVGLCERPRVVKIEPSIFLPTSIHRFSRHPDLNGVRKRTGRILESTDRIKFNIEDGPKDI